MLTRTTTSWPVLILIYVGSNAAHAAFAPELAALSSQHQHQHHPGSTILTTTGPGQSTALHLLSTTGSAAGDPHGDKDDCYTSTSPLLLSRRIFTTRSAAAVTSIIVPLSTILTPEKASAGIDMTSLKTIPIEGDATGAASRIKQLKQKKHKHAPPTKEMEPSI